MKLEVPFWREHLLIGAKAYEMTGLGYLGADIVMDKYKGPMMLELNARPGLAIQIANGRGLDEILSKIDKEYPIGLTYDILLLVVTIDNVIMLMFQEVGLIVISLGINYV